MPTRFGRSEVSKADQRLSRALSHPLRAECLTILNARVASPAEIARELEVEVSNVSYHVKQLLELDCVELVNTKQVRGATEHFYRGVAKKYLHDDMWSKLSHKETLERGMAIGARAIAREAEERLNAIRQSSGALTGIYRPDELKRLREDWPD